MPWAWLRSEGRRGVVVVMMSAAGLLLAVLGVKLSIDVLGVLGIGLAVIAGVIAFGKAESKRQCELAELRGEVEALRGLGDEVAVLRQEVASLRERA